MDPFIPRILPHDRWDGNDDLVSPCPIEKAVVHALKSVHNSIRAYTTITGMCHHDVNAKIYHNLISGMILTNLYGMKSYEIPDPAYLSQYLCSICKEMMDYDNSTVEKVVDHYITNGTRGFDDLKLGTDNFQFFLIFMDIKSAVHHWSTTEKGSKRRRL